MNFRHILLAGILSTAVLAAGQSVPAQTPPPGGQPESGAGAEQNTMSPGMAHPPRRGMEGSSEERGQMHAQEMAQMRQQVTKMRSLLDQMKTNVAGMSGKDKAAMQANVQLWQMMVDHMDQMMQHMSSMGGPGRMGMGQNMRGMHHPGEMKQNDKIQGPASGPPPPPERNNPVMPPQG